MAPSLDFEHIVKFCFLANSFYEINKNNDIRDIAMASICQLRAMAMAMGLVVSSVTVRGVVDCGLPLVRFSKSG